MKLTRKLFHEARFEHSEFFCSTCGHNDWERIENGNYSCKKCNNFLILQQDQKAFELEDSQY